MKNRVLVVIAHSDDEVLGCGGTMSKHIAKGDEVFVLVLTNGESSRADFNIEKRHNCFLKSCKVLGVQNHFSINLNDGHLDTYPLIEIVKEIEKISLKLSPNIVYTHNYSDLNIDHAITNKAVMTAFRALPISSISQILTFEVPSSTEWGSVEDRSRFIPNYFVELSEQDFALKLTALRCYQDEMRDFPHPRSEEYITSLAKVRGGAVGVRLAEAFFAERIIVRS